MQYGTFGRISQKHAKELKSDRNANGQIFITNITQFEAALATTRIKKEQKIEPAQNTQRKQ